MLDFDKNIIYLKVQTYLKKYIVKCCISIFLVKIKDNSKICISITVYIIGCINLP